VRIASCGWHGSAYRPLTGGCLRRLEPRNGRWSTSHSAPQWRGSCALRGIRHLRARLRANWIARWALGIQELRIVLVDAGRAKLAGLDRHTYEAFIARTAWHEWGHALSVVRCSPEDVAASRRLLGLAPEGVREGIRNSGYRSSDYTHELVAETYALLIARHRRKVSGKPSWLDHEIYSLVKRVTGRSD
jgi:hypothetical protein